MERLWIIKADFQGHAKDSILLDSEPWKEEKLLAALKAHHQLSGLRFGIMLKQCGDALLVSVALNGNSRCLSPGSPL